MKRLLLIGMLLLIPTMLSAQKTREFDSDSLTVTTTPNWAKYPTMWESATITFTGCTGQIKLAMSANDTTWTDKTWFMMPANSSLVVTKNPMLGIVGIFRAYYRCVSGTGAMLITGTRTSDT